MMGCWQLHWDPCLQPPGKLGHRGCSDPAGVTVLLTGAAWQPCSIPPLQGHILLPMGASRPTARLLSPCHAAWGYRVTLVVFTLLPLLQLHPDRSGSTLHSSPSRHGSIWHHHFCSTMEASTQEGAARVVPATCPGKQEHFTVWERSSILFLLQHR